MPPAARLNDQTEHAAPPLSPGIGSLNIMIGNQPAWRCLPTSVGGALAQVSMDMAQILMSPIGQPPALIPKMVKVGVSLINLGVQSAMAMKPAVVSTAASQFGTAMGTTSGLTATWAAASVVPGGQPMADIMFSAGAEVAIGLAATMTFVSMFGMADAHNCAKPLDFPPGVPHGPGYVCFGSPNVIFNNLPAARQDDIVFEAMGFADKIVKGEPTVIIN